MTTIHLTREERQQLLEVQQFLARLESRCADVEKAAEKAAADSEAARLQRREASERVRLKNVVRDAEEAAAMKEARRKENALQDQLVWTR